MKKKIEKLNKETNEVLAVFDSVSSAYRDAGLTHHGKLNEACKNGTELAGYKWRYQDEDNSSNTHQCET